MEIGADGRERLMGKMQEKERGKGQRDRGGRERGNEIERPIQIERPE